MTGRILALVLVAAGLLAGCGKAGKPEFPEDAIYQLRYPDPHLVSGKTVGAPGTTLPTAQVFVDPSVKYEYLLHPGFAGQQTSSGPIGNDLGLPESFGAIPTMRSMGPGQTQ